jgi:hypothetical protein
MTDQSNTLSAQSLQDSLLSDPNAHYTKPLRPPRSNASRSQKDAPKPTALTAEALAKLPPKDSNQAAVYKFTRIKKFLHRLPDPEDLCNIFAHPYPDTRTEEPQPYHYETDSLPSSPTQRLSKAKPKAKPHHHIPLASSDMHLWQRFQKMQCEEKYAEFHRHRAWLTLQYAEDGKVAMFVGVDDQEHGFRIHRHMVWLRDKWLGKVGLFYHVMEYEAGDDREKIKGRDKKAEKEVEEEEEEEEEKEKEVEEEVEEEEIREINW